MLRLVAIFFSAFFGIALCLPLSPLYIRLFIIISISLLEALPCAVSEDVMLPCQQSILCSAAHARPIVLPEARVGQHQTLT